MRFCHVLALTFLLGLAGGATDLAVALSLKHRTAFSGMAHAQEHMAFRGCTGLSTDQIAAIYAQLGGSNNADTLQNVTQYFTTVPREDLDLVLRMDAACMAGIGDLAVQGKALETQFGVAEEYRHASVAFAAAALAPQADGGAAIASMRQILAD